MAQEDREKAAEFAKEFKVGFPVIFDPKLKIAGDYQGRTLQDGIGTPYLVLVGRDGKVVKHFDGGGAVRDGTLAKTVKELAEKK